LTPNSEGFDSFAPAHFDLRFAHLCRSRPGGSIREQALSELMDTLGTRR